MSYIISSVVKDKNMTHFAVTFQTPRGNVAPYCVCLFNRRRAQEVWDIWLLLRHECKHVIALYIKNHGAMSYVARRKVFFNDSLL